MSTAPKARSHAGLSLRFTARITGALYLLVIGLGISALVFLKGSPWQLVTNLAGDVCYVAVTLLLYYLFSPANRILSAIAALFSLVGCALGILDLFNISAFGVNPLVFFGFYCLLLSYLIFKSAFMPRSLAALTALAALGWLTYLSPPFARSLYPSQIVSGLIGEGALMLWLLVKGVDEARWRTQASAGATSRP